MTQVEKLKEWRAEKLGYVLFSRLDNLIIEEANSGNSLFDYLIDIGENHAQTGRLFGVEIKLYPKRIDKTILARYKNISFPALIASFDNKTDNGYFQWIKKPGNNGGLLFNTENFPTKPLDTEALKRIVSEIEGWYARKSVTKVVA